MMRPAVVVMLALAALPAVAANPPSVVSPLNGSGVSASPLGAPTHGPGLILNGNFEITSFTGCDFNQLNASFTAGMSNATGFGTAEEIDVMVSPTGCAFMLAPTSGSVKIGITSVSAGGIVDAFSFDLSAPLVSGEAYTLNFDAIAYAQGFAPDTGDVQIGVSTVPNAFGTLVYSATPLGINWQSFGTTFVAPNNGQYLTVRQVNAGDIWNHLDSFSLTPTPIGTKYCSANSNSTGSRADIAASRSASSSAGNLTLSASPVPNQSGLFFHGSNAIQVSFGNGFLCIGGGIVRGDVLLAAGNVSSYTYDNSSLKRDLSPYIGQLRRFQYLHRDPMGGGALCNTSNAIAIQIVP